MTESSAAFRASSIFHQNEIPTPKSCGVFFYTPSQHAPPHTLAANPSLRLVPTRARHGRQTKEKTRPGSSEYLPARLPAPPSTAPSPTRYLIGSHAGDLVTYIASGPCLNEHLQSAHTTVRIARSAHHPIPIGVDRSRGQGRAEYRTATPRCRAGVGRWRTPIAPPP